MINIIPAIDMIDGHCVRLVQGDYKRLTVYGNPLEIAIGYRDAGFKRLHLVDLDGAKASQPVNLKMLEHIATATDLDIQYGGGIKNQTALESVFNAGASRAIGGSIAVIQPEIFSEWLKKFSPDRIILGADIRDGYIATNGWIESSRTTVSELIQQFLSDGLSQVICTDISKDGMLCGPNFTLYKELSNNFSELAITVSGGISSMKDIIRLNDEGMHSVIIGKALYEERITLKQINDFIC